MPSPIDPPNPPSTSADLDVRGDLPLGLSGRLVGLGDDDLVHCFHFDTGRVSYLASPFVTGAAVKDLVAFEGSALVYGDDLSVRQLMTDAGTLRQVDLAGHRRTVASCPRYDSVSGELHLVARDGAGAQTYVVVSAGALTRRSHLIVDAPERIQGLAIGPDHVVFVADSVAGVASRNGEMRINWMPTGVPSPWAVDTHRAGGTVILVALTPSLERWILHTDGGVIEREVLDPTPRRFAHSSDHASHGSPGFVWSTGAQTISRHDLRELRGARLDVTPQAPHDFVVVPDASRAGTVGTGWFVGFVHNATGSDTELWVVDTADLAARAIVKIRIPRPIPLGLRCAWMPAARNDPQHSPTSRTDGS